MIALIAICPILTITPMFHMYAKRRIAYTAFLVRTSLECVMKRKVMNA